MLKEERQALILNKLHSSGKVVVSRLAVELGVSEDTIRRDLLDLDQKGQVKRVFGGAIPMEDVYKRQGGLSSLRQESSMSLLISRPMILLPLLDSWLST